MGSICLSSAPILRCTSLSSIQNIVIIIPPALEVVVTTSLVFINRDSRRRHLLLSAEGWIYFLLAMVELLSQILPAVRENLSISRSLDTGIGVASFLPLFFYTFFLYLFTKAELVETLPTTVRNVAKLTLITFVPAIVISNGVASFVGVSIRNIPPFFPVIVGFSSKRQEGLWTFFTSLTLAFIMIFQMTIFSFAFFRLFEAVGHQRRMESQRNNAVHMIKGTGWISGAMNLGAVEALIGFAGGGFVIALTRRIIRLLSRACLCIGLAKGVDAVEHPCAVRNNTYTGQKSEDFRRPRPLFISLPRFSTARELSPAASSFHAAPRAPHYLLKRDTLERPMSGKQGLVGMEYFAQLKEMKARERVTVLHNDGAPTLHLRFSSLDLPSPDVIAERVESRPQSELEVYLPQKRDPTPPPRSQAQVEEIKQRLEEELFFQPPQPSFFKESKHLPSDSLTSTESVSTSSGVAEIVSLPRQMEMLRPARAQVYQAPISVNITVTTTNSNDDVPSTTSPVIIQEPMYQQSALSPVSESLSRTDRSHIKSISVRSIPDSLQAVRELAGQFPGPPLSSFPEEQGIQSQWDQDLWEDMPIPQALGSPSDLIFSNPPVFPAARADDDPTWGSLRSSPILFVPADPDANSASPGYSFNKATGTPLRTPVETTNPFNDEADGAYESNPAPWAPLRTGRRPSRPFHLPTTPNSSTQGTPLRGSFTPASPRAISTEIYFNGRTARIAGGPNVFRAPQRDTSTGSSGPSRSAELARVAEWVNSNATAQSSKADKDLHTKSLQNLHERGQSIDNLAISWPKGPPGLGEEDRSGEANSQVPLSRIKSVGRAPSRSTPAPLRSSYSRGSLHLEPIIIPPPNRSMPEIIQETEESLESTESGRRVLRDAEVLAMENSRYVGDRYF